MEIKKTTVFILCAGDGERWNNYLGIPKQLIKFSEETLIDRTIRLVKSENPGVEIFIVTENTLLKHEQAAFFIPERSGCTVQTFLSTKNHWLDDNIILLGDVFYSEATIKKILRTTDRVHFVGKVGRCKFGTRRNGEIFGFRFTSGEIVKIKQFGEQILDYARGGAIGNLWDLYHLMSGLPMNSGRVNFENFYCQNDYTDDFDTPKDYEEFKAVYQKIAGQTSIKKLTLLAYLKLQEYVLDWRSKRFKGYQADDWSYENYKNSAA